MNNSNDIKLVNENGKDKTYGQIPDIYGFAGIIGDTHGESAREMVLQVWMMAHDLKSVIEQQDQARLTEVRGMNFNQLGQLDAICAANTAFPTFFALVDAKGNYRPTIDQSESWGIILANAYDTFQADRGSDLRAFRTGGK